MLGAKLQALPAALDEFGIGLGEAVRGFHLPVFQRAALLV